MRIITYHRRDKNSFKPNFPLSNFLVVISNLSTSLELCILVYFITVVGKRVKKEPNVILHHCCLEISENLIIQKLFKAV